MLSSNTNWKSESKYHLLRTLDIVLYDHFNDINIIKPLKNLFGEKNIFKLAQQVRIDISPDYYHALRWHQDHFDFTRHESGSSLNINYSDSYTVWSPFTKANKNIGTMEILVGSHNYGRHKHEHQYQSSHQKKSGYLELKVPQSVLDKCKPKIIEVTENLLT